MILELILIIASLQPIAPKLPTPEITQLINRLGDKNYRVREAAQKKLIELKSEAFHPCLAQKEHIDPEIAQRCKIITEYYFDKVWSEEYPSIYLLSNKERYPFGVHYKIQENNYYCNEYYAMVDLSWYYFRVIREKYIKNTRENINKFDIFSWEINKEIEAEAMRQYVRDLLVFGHSYQKISETLADTKNKRNLYITTYKKKYIWPSPPGPAVNIEAIKEFNP